MQIDVAESIRRVLDKRQSVCIDGIGTFRLVNISAKFGDKRESILPPSVDIEFDSAISSNDALTRFISDRYKISEKNANKAINIFNKRIFNGLFNYGKVNILGLGTLQNSANGKTEFTVDPAFTSQYYRNLPEVPIKFIDRSVKNESVVTPPPVIVESKQTESLETLMDRIQKTEVEKDNTRVTEIKTPPEVFALNEETKPQDPVWHPEPKKKKTYWIPALIATAAILLIFSGLKTCQWIKGDKAETTNSITENEAIGEDRAEELQMLMEENAEEEVMLLPTECIIITGVFASQGNIDRMISKLEANGYVPYMEPFGPYTRTGIRFACNDLDLEAYIRNVRQTMEANAWYLDPQLHVPF